MNISLADLLSQVEADTSERVKILPEAAVERLTEAFNAYHAPNRWKPGMIVTPRTDSNLKDAGDPHIVMEVRDDLTPHFGEDPSSSLHGYKVDTRIAMITPNDAIVFFWVHHWQLKEWAP